MTDEYLQIMNMKQLVHDLVMAWGVQDTPAVHAIIKELARRYI